MLANAVIRQGLVQLCSIVRLVHFFWVLLQRGTHVEVLAILAEEVVSAQSLPFQALAVAWESSPFLARGSPAFSNVSALHGLTDCSMPNLIISSRANKII